MENMLLKCLNDELAQWNVGSLTVINKCEFSYHGNLIISVVDIMLFK